MVLDREITAYEDERAELEREHAGMWAVYKDDRREGVFETFEIAAENAVKRFGRGPFLIRQIGAPEPVLPASVVFNVI